MSNWIKNQVGHAKSYGGCERCGDRWNWKKSHSLMYSDTWSCFPLCEECWKDSTREEKLKHYLGHLYRYPDQDLDYEVADKRLREQIDDYHSSKPTRINTISTEDGGPNKDE